MKADTLGELKFNSLENEWRVTTQNISPENSVELSLCVTNKDENIDKSYIRNLDTAIVNRNEMKKIYLTISKDKVAVVLEPLSYNLSKDDIKKQMDVAPKDITWFAKNTMYAGSSEDNLLSLVAITINNVQDDTRKEHQEIMRKLNSKLEALEKTKNNLMF